jgi:AcrR family transcriptional regulator
MFAADAGARVVGPVNGREDGVARRSPAVRDTKELLLKAALDVFSEQGYATASVDEIAARAGVTKGAVYYWFRDKEDLATDLLRTLWTEIAHEAQRDVDPTAGTVENIKRSFRAYLRSLHEHAHARFFLRDCWAIPSLEAAGRVQHEAEVVLVQRQVEQGIARGELVDVDPETLTRVLLGAFAEATLHVLTSGRAEDALEVVERVVDAFAAEPAAAKEQS